MSKEQGDISEFEFIQRAKKLGFNVLMPYHAISSKTSLFYPEKKEHKFNQYKENWELLQ